MLTDILKIVGVSVFLLIHITNRIICERSACKSVKNFIL